MTLEKLQNYMRQEKANEFVPGRTTKNSIPDVMGKGMYIAMTTQRAAGSKVPGEDEDEWANFDLDELALDFEEDGNLDDLWD